mmetsp:Transcript_5949/g.6487  ORF Transcript_5949/g.6487 Transcript_5949/m.6487 type:complete len:426 (-) Transcript_5949:60-1337(-)
MSTWSTLPKGKLSELKVLVQKQYDEFKGRNLKLDMTRGKPSAEQLNLSNELLGTGGEPQYTSSTGQDCRNYGGLLGIPEMRKFFADCFFDSEPDEVVIGGNASLTLMYDFLARGCLFGFNGETPLCQVQGKKWLCPVPGYDRHFKIVHKLGFELITIPSDENGPNMDIVEKHVKDPLVKGMWCVPKHANPSGCCYSDEVVDRLANMEVGAKDFKLFWDDAYHVHDLVDSAPKLKSILAACKKAGNPNRPVLFASTSKITFASAGVSAFCTSKENLADAEEGMNKQSIGPDKLNQLRHIKFLKDKPTLTAHMKKHAAILKPKFDMVLDILQTEIGDKGIATWTKPTGGYFICLDTLEGCGKRVVALASDAGVALTKAGAVYPHFHDPRDQTLRIAPSLPPVADLKLAAKGLTICIQLASLEKLLAN